MRIKPIVFWKSKYKTKAYRKKSKYVDKKKYGIYFVLPFMIVLLFMKILPMLYAIGLSFVSWNGLDDKVFIGFKNYARLVKDINFYKAIYNTFIIWFINVFFRMGIALLCALVFAQSRLKGKQLFKAIYYFPNLVTASSIAVFATLALDYQNGILNQIFMSMGLIQDNINWLQVPILSRFSVGAIIWWMWFGYASILFTTGILSIPNDVIESSIVDGANAWQRFWKIVMPLLKPTYSYVFITSLIGGLQNFEIPRLLTDGRGAPDKSLLTMVMQLYNLTFQNFQYGYGATYAVALFIIIASVSMFTLRSMTGERDTISRNRR